MEKLEVDLLKAIKRGLLLDFMYEKSLEEHHHDEKILPDLLSSMHNEGKLDLVNEFKRLHRKKKQHEFFILRQLFEKVLPNLSASVIDVMSCIKHLTFEAENDMTAYILMGPFKEYCQNDISRPRQTIEFSVTEVNQDVDFITPAIEAGTKLDLEEFHQKAIELTKHPDPLVVQKAVFSLGRIDYLGNHDLIEQTYVAVIKTSSKHSIDQILATTLKTLFALILQENSMEERLINFIEKYTLSPGDQLIHAASEILFYEKDKSPEKIENALLELVINVSSENTGTLNNLDLAFSDLIQRDRYSKVIEIVEAIIDKNDSKIKLNAFDNTERQLLENKDVYLPHLFTRWLLSGRVVYGRCCLDLLTDAPDKGIELSFDLFQLHGEFALHHEFLARKACGWFFTSPLTAISLITSLIDSCPEEQFEPILEISFHPLLISYPGSVKAYLDSTLKTATGKILKFCTSLLKKLERYHKGLEASIDVKELKPSEENRFIYNQYQQKMMQKSMKQAEEGSFFLSMVKKSVVLYGRKSINYIHNGNKKIRTEMPFQTISTSFEYPSLEMLDPHNLNFQMMQFRLEGCHK